MLHEKQSSEPAVIEPLVSDECLIEVWLYGRPTHTVRAYASDIKRFRNKAGKPLPTITSAGRTSAVATPILSCITSSSPLNGLSYGNGV
jgi:hypothetical protein